MRVNSLRIDRDGIQHEREAASRLRVDTPAVAGTLGTSDPRERELRLYEPRARRAWGSHTYARLKSCHTAREDQVRRPPFAQPGVVNGVSSASLVDGGLMLRRWRTHLE